MSRRDRSLLTYEFLSRTLYSKKDDPSNSLANEPESRFGIERLIANATFLDAYPTHEILDKRSHEVMNPAKMKESDRRQVVLDFGK